MRYEYNSDITKITSGIIAHGVNCQRVMGSGVAKALYTKWSRVRSEYMNIEPVIGSYHTVVINENLIVCNCYTQEFYGRDSSIQYASYGAINSALSELAKECDNCDNREINIPKIGSGLGGLNWMKVKELVLKIEEKYDVEFIVHLIDKEFIKC